MKRLLGSLALALIAACSICGCSSQEPSTATVTVEGIEKPLIRPYNGGTVYVEKEGKKTALGQETAIDNGTPVYLDGTMLVTAGLSDVTIKVGSRLVVEIPALASVQISEDGEVELNALIPRQIRVTGAKRLIVKVACSASAIKCDYVGGFAASRIYAKECKNVSVNTFASATAVDCGEVKGEDRTSLDATGCKKVVGSGHCSVTARKCDHVIGYGESSVTAKDCKKVELFDNARKTNFLGF